MPLPVCSCGGKFETEYYRLLDCLSMLGMDTLEEVSFYRKKRRGFEIQDNSTPGQVANGTDVFFRGPYLPCLPLLLRAARKEGKKGKFPFYWLLVFGVVYLNFYLNLANEILGMNFYKQAFLLKSISEQNLEFRNETHRGWTEEDDGLQQLAMSLDLFVTHTKQVPECCLFLQPEQSALNRPQNARNQR